MIAEMLPTTARFLGASMIRNAPANADTATFVSLMAAAYPRHIIILSFDGSVWAWPIDRQLLTELSR